MSLRVGVIGCGNISRFHLQGYREAGADIVAVSDLNQDLAKRTAERYRCEYTADYRKLLERRDIQAVSVCLPNYMHFQAAVDALDAGKAVLCEKPMTTNVGDSERLVKKVKDNGGKLQIAYMKRFHPAFKRFKEWAESIGTIENGLVRVYHPFPEGNWARQEKNPTWFTQKEKSGGGSLVHSGSHMIDIMRWVAGDPVRVYARIKMKPKFDVDYLTNALLEMRGGATLFLEVGWLPLTGVGFRDNGWDELIELRGREGKATIYSTWWDAPDHEIPVAELYTESDKRTQRYAPGRIDYFTEEIKAFVRAVEEGRPLSPDVVDGYKVEAITYALYESSEIGKPVDIKYKH
ncbi:MAG: Gfo/Idh/MocA family protein [bacterium]